MGGSSQGVIVASLICLVLVAMIPLAALYVTKGHRQRHRRLSAAPGCSPPQFLVPGCLEFALAGLLAGVLIRMVASFEVVLADRYGEHVGTRIMEHARKLDLTTSKTRCSTTR